MKRLADTSLLVFITVLGSASAARADTLASRLGFAPRVEHVTEIAGSSVMVAGVGRAHARRLACSSLSVNAADDCEDFEGMTAVLAWDRDTGDAIAWRVEGEESLASIEAAPVELDGDEAPEIAILADTAGLMTRTVLVLDVGPHGFVSLLCKQYDVRDVDIGDDEIVLRGVTASFVDIDGDGRAELRLAGEWDADVSRGMIAARFSRGDEEDEEHGYFVFEEAIEAHEYAYYAFDVALGRFTRMLVPDRQ